MNRFWLGEYPVRLVLKELTKFLYFQFELNLGSARNPGHSFWLVRCFSFLCLNNFLGLLPYVFTASSHLVFSLRFALVR